MSAKSRDQHSNSIDTQAASHTTNVATPMRPEGGGSALWWCAGVVASTCGIALAAAPALSWEAQQFVQSLGSSVAQGAALAVGGLGLIALGSVRRSQARAAQNDTSLVLDQVATDLVLMHGQVEELGKRCERMTGALDAVASELTRLGECQRASAATNGSENALFGLASSLDKLGAKLEQRIATQQSSMQESFEDLHNGLVRSHQCLAEQLTHSAGTFAAAPTEPRAPLPNHDAADTSAGSLGVLDSIDDHAPAHGYPARGIDLNELNALQQELQRSAYARALDAELEHVELDAGRAKLDQLESLLADPELRALLDGLRSRA